MTRSPGFRAFVAILLVGLSGAAHAVEPTSGPFGAAMREVNATMDEIERIYAKGSIK